MTYGLFGRLHLNLRQNNSRRTRLVSIQLRPDADGGLSAGQAPQESKADGWQARKVRQALKEKYPPDGDPPIEMTLTAILKSIDPIFEARKWKLASPDTLARVTGRRPA